MFASTLRRASARPETKPTALENPAGSTHKRPSLLAVPRAPGASILRGKSSIAPPTFPGSGILAAAQRRSVARVSRTRCARSEERRVGKECRARGGRERQKEKRKGAEGESWEKEETKN